MIPLNSAAREDRMFIPAGACLAAVTFLLAACGTPSEGGANPDAATNGVGSGMGPGISIQDALASRLDGPLLVNGWLRREEGGEVLLCISLTESLPPQCVKPSLSVRGLDVGAVADLRSERGVSWSARSIQLLGEVRGGVLTIAALSKG